jgi:CspA family cold shock protein
MSERLQGRVKWFNDSKGYGFIARDGGDDVFFHHSELQMPGYKTIEENARVEFDIEEGPKGPAAVNVVKLD